MTPAGLELTISAGERLQTYALQRAATGSPTISNFTYSEYPFTIIWYS